LYKRIENEEELETPVTPIIPYRLSTTQRSTTYNESDNLINQQPLHQIITTDTTSLNNNNNNSMSFFFFLNIFMFYYFLFFIELNIVIY